MKVNKTVGDWGLLDAVANFHASRRYVTEEIPPLWMVRKSGIRNAGNEARYFEEVVDFAKVGVGEGMTSEAAEDTS